MGPEYSFLSSTMMFWAKSFQFSLGFTVKKIKQKKKLVLQALIYGKNSSSKNKPFPAQVRAWGLGY